MDDLWTLPSKKHGRDPDSIVPGGLDKFRKEEGPPQPQRVKSDANLDDPAPYVNSGHKAFHAVEKAFGSALQTKDERPPASVRRAADTSFVNAQSGPGSGKGHGQGQVQEQKKPQRGHVQGSLSIKEKAPPDDPLGPGNAKTSQTSTFKPAYDPHRTAELPTNAKNSDRPLVRNEEDIGHLVTAPGQVLGGRFTVQRLLGEGTFGKVWSCEDAKHKDIVAVKCIRKIDRYTSSAKIEAKVLRQTYYEQDARRVQLLVKLYTTFVHDGHLCMVFEPLGRSLLDYVEQNNYHGFPLQHVRAIGAQLLSAVAFMSSYGLIHTDLKLENVLFVPGSGECDMQVERVSARGNNSSSSSSSAAAAAAAAGGTSKMCLPRLPHVKIIDFGGATFDREKKSTIINTRQYRGPEVTLELGWSFPSDVWSVGCILAELFTGNLLFSTHENLEHLAIMEHTIGLFPVWMAREAPESVSRKYFEQNTHSVRQSDLTRQQREDIRRLPTLHDLAKEPFYVAAGHGNGNGRMSNTNTEERPLRAAQEFVDVLSCCLRLDPQKRATAREAMRNPFFDPVDVSRCGWGGTGTGTRTMMAERARPLHGSQSMK